MTLSRHLRGFVGPWAVTAIAAASFGQAASPASEGRDGPNIILIYADDHAQRAIGCYGSPLVSTPNIDRLAAEGVRFTQSFVANSICAPARATVLTGLHSRANGQTTNGGGFDDELPTWPKLLGAAGYETAMIGKWHLPTDPSGFDHWVIARGGYYNPDLVRPGSRERATGYTTEVLWDEALSWLEGRADSEEPFVLWWSHAAVHRTWMPGPSWHGLHAEGAHPEPATLFDDYSGRSPAAAAAQMRIAEDLFRAYDLKLPPTGEGVLDARAAAMLERLTGDQRRAWEEAYAAPNAAFAAERPEGDDLVRWKYQRYVADYLRCVSALDDAVGRLVDWLDEAGLAEDTVVIYTSDQGFFLGEHGWYDKRWIYEPSFATPLIVRWPGRAEAGTTCSELVQNIDLAPTLLALGGVDVPGSMHGVSLRPLIEGVHLFTWRREVYYEYFQRDSGRLSHTVAPHYGLRTQRHKLLHVPDHDFWELYDLHLDPDETTNLYADPAHAALVATLAPRLATLRERYGGPADR
ncbi:MAG: sulfatase [Planctomycetota bacterium]|jgi:arylsulfatase A-like enzyme|nr:sulfatase [Planctomycetota bacterium]